MGKQKRQGTLPGFLPPDKKAPSERRGHIGKKTRALMRVANALSTVVRMPLAMDLSNRAHSSSIG